jgi:XTP/dITP diphosphohydrolase
LTLLQDVPDDRRGARFRCVLAFSQPNDPKTHWVEGVCEGAIGRASRGDFGFGYDPLFIPTGYRQTFGELGKDVKNRLSHRASALRKIKPLLFDILRGV